MIEYCSLGCSLKYGEVGGFKKIACQFNNRTSMKGP